MSTSDTPLVRFQNPANLPSPAGFSQLVEIGSGGRLILISGQASLDAAGHLIGANDFRAQVTQTFRNLEVALAAAGASFSDVVKLNYYCVESVPDSEIPVLREVRNQFLNTQPPPASTLVFVSRPVRPDWLVEIEAMAVVRSA
jgi:enamine deaminase RidA (YjgF/YER057c/UK114 family)